MMWHDTVLDTFQHSRIACHRMQKRRPRTEDAALSLYCCPAMLSSSRYRSNRRNQCKNTHPADNHTSRTRTVHASSVFSSHPGLTPVAHPSYAAFAPAMQLISLQSL